MLRNSLSDIYISIFIDKQVSIIARLSKQYKPSQDNKATIHASVYILAILVKNIIRMMKKRRKKKKRRRRRRRRWWCWWSWCLDGMLDAGNPGIFLQDRMFGKKEWEQFLKSSLYLYHLINRFLPCSVLLPRLSLSTYFTIITFSTGTKSLRLTLKYSDFLM